MADGRDRYMFWSGRVPSERPLELSEERERGKKKGGRGDRRWQTEAVEASNHRGEASVQNDGNEGYRGLRACAMARLCEEED